MKYHIRALLAVGLLVGFYVSAVLIVAALVWAGSLLITTWARNIGVGLWILAVVVAVAIGRALFSGQKTKLPEPDGLVLEEIAQPSLWREVREVAAFADTRAPDEIRLVAVANAAVAEETWLLGLVGGTRKMYLGAPLLIGLTREQFRSMLAHELGHYSRRHTALGAVTYRGKEAIGRALSELDHGFVHLALELYARLYLAVSQTVNRRQEFEADRISAELVGADTAAEALRQAVVIDSAWEFFLEQYVSPGVEQGSRPHDVFDGFRCFLANPERQNQVAELKANLKDRPLSIYDSHPPITKRLAAFDNIAASGAQDISATAATLLSDPQTDLAELGEVLCRDSGLTPTTFEEIAALAGRSKSEHNARFFLNVVGNAGIATPTLGGAVGAMKEGRSEELVRLVNDTDLTAREKVGAVLGDAAAYSMLEQGSARYVLDWAGPPRLVDERGESLDPWTPFCEALAADGDAVAALEAWLDGHNVARDIEVPPPVEDERENPPDEPTVWLGVVAPVKTGWFTRPTVLGVTDSGVLICKPRSEDRWAASFALQSFRDDGRVYAKRMIAREPIAVLADGQSRHFRWADISLFVARNGRFSRRAQLTARDGSTVTLRWSVLAYSEGQLWPVITHFLGDRFRVEEKK